MQGINVILKKELADHFSSYRFVIIFALIAMISLITAYMVGLNIRQQLEGVAKPRFIFLMLFTAPEPSTVPKYGMHWLKQRNFKEPQEPLH